MHVCVIGTGASGWISAYLIKDNPNVDKVTIIGSPNIPSIGVGESTTGAFPEFLHVLNRSGYDMFKFLVDIDAAVKYGVYYKDWSNKDFLHCFISEDHDIQQDYLMGGLGKNENENHYMMPLYDEIVNNNLFNFDHRAQKYTFHFDAGKFISALKNFSKNVKTLTHIKDTVIGCNKHANDDETIESIVLQERGEFKADYYINCIGQRSFNENIFGETYHDYSNILLTDTALFYPLEYTNKKEQFHPYTVAKAMNNGWRWITPTWSRIGTGYAFSNKYTSIENAKEEFCNDIGIKEAEPFTVNFEPKRVNKVYKHNYCTIGMAAGFLEPLDAPGLAMTVSFINVLSDIFDNNNTFSVKNANNFAESNYNLWAAFILHQYKTSTRNDTEFWIDHRNIQWDYYDGVMEYLYGNINSDNAVKTYEPTTFYYTAAGKGHRWKLSRCSIKDRILGRNVPKKQAITREQLPKHLREYSFNHLDFFDHLHRIYND